MGRREDKKIRNKYLLQIILLILLIIIISINVYYFLELSKIVEVKVLNASVIVSDITGFDLNASALTFGKITRGGSATRGINIKNNQNFPVKVYISAKGEIKNFIFSANYRLEKNQEKSIKISVVIPLDAVFGEYSGKVIVKIKKDI